MGSRRTLGRWGEDVALAFLESQGFEIVERNWRYHRLGEVDLIARKEDCLIFIEVRVRRGSSYGTPEESITPAKRERLIALVEAYSQAEDWQGDCRIDVIALEVDAQGRLIRRHHIENAVTGWDCSQEGMAF